MTADGERDVRRDAGKKRDLESHGRFSCLVPAAEIEKKRTKKGIAK